MEAGNQPPQDVDQLKLRELTSDFAEESSEGGSDTSSVQKLADSLSVIVETLNSASKGKSKGKGKKGSAGPRFLHGRPVAGHIAECGVAIVSRGRSLRKQEEPWKSSRKKAKGKGKSGGKAKGKGKGLVCFVCRGIGHPARLCPCEAWDDDLEQDEDTE